MTDSKDRSEEDAPSRLDRRAALKLGVGLATLVVGCGDGAVADPRGAPLPAGDDGPEPAPAGGASPPPSPAAPPTASPGSADGGVRDNTPPPPPPPTAKELLAGIETIVVVMMENRSFDHYLGRLRGDASYRDALRVEGLLGVEWNPDARGERVGAFRLDGFTTEDPPHEWDACRAQWNLGKNDGFVRAHAGPNERDVMGFYEREQLPFLYWLADNFTVCDRWFASVLGPTWPNRYFLHAGGSNGEKGNSPFRAGGLPTVWDRLRDLGLPAKNYAAGIVAWLTGGFPGKNFKNNPVRRLDEFFRDAKQGTLPPFAIVDPDFSANDDHPAHDVRKGQAFLASIYAAMAASPQWKKSLLVITYDEHGGFFDHVAPPEAKDDLPEFRQLGFRVPSLVVGPTVRRGRVVSTELEHCSVAATLATRFGIEPLSTRMSAAADLSSCIDPALVASPLDPPPAPPPVTLTGLSAWLETEEVSSQPALEVMLRRRTLAAEAIDRRSRAERLGSWVRAAAELGAIRVR